MMGRSREREMIAVNARVFANKGNAKDITPSEFQVKEPVVTKMWRKIASLPHFSRGWSEETDRSASASRFESDRQNCV